MALAAADYFKVSVNGTKTDVTKGTGLISVGADEMALQIGASASVANVQAIVGTFEQLRKHALNYLTSYDGTVGVLTLSLPVGGFSANAVTTAPAATALTLHIDDGVLATEKSHFIDKTFKDLIAKLIEASA